MCIVDDVYVFFSFCEVFSGENIVSVVGQRYVQCDEISVGEQVIEFDFFNVYFVCFFFREEWVKGDDFYFQIMGMVVNDIIDVVCIDNVEGFVGQFNIYEFGFFLFVCVGGF